jgi:hypothetical protein
MNTTPVTPTNLAVLARMLDRLERSGRPVDAGLCRSSLDLGLAAESAAREAINRAKNMSTRGPEARPA